MENAVMRVNEASCCAVLSLRSIFQCCSPSSNAHQFGSITLVKVQGAVRLLVVVLRVTALPAGSRLARTLAHAQ